MAEYPSRTNNYFYSAFGFSERSEESEENKANFACESDENGGIFIHSKRNGRIFYVGKFETLMLKELKERLGERIDRDDSLGGMTFEHVAGNVTNLIEDDRNAGAVFQCASQFNCLEMVGPTVTPEQGITRYQYDGTQGPACAIACAAGTLYRNYFVNGGKGQCAPNGTQINCLDAVADLLTSYKPVNSNNTSSSSSIGYFHIQNGYCFGNYKNAMFDIGQLLSNDVKLREDVHNSLKQGIHWSTDVRRGEHRVAQVYCSALPISYSHNYNSISDFKMFGKTILSSAYESTIAVGAILSREKSQRVKVFLTKLGGGVFGNPDQWICDAIQAALRKYKDYPLDVYLVHFGSISPEYKGISI